MNWTKFLQHVLDEWAEIFDSEPDLFWAPVNSPDDLLADQTFSGSGALFDVPDGSTGTLMISTPVDFHRTPEPRIFSPKLGEHTAEILKELGLSESEIDSMHSSGIVIDGSKAEYNPQRFSASRVHAACITSLAAGTISKKTKSMRE